MRTTTTYTPGTFVRFAVNADGTVGAPLDFDSVETTAEPTVKLIKLSVKSHLDKFHPMGFKSDEVGLAQKTFDALKSVGLEPEMWYLFKYTDGTCIGKKKVERMTKSDLLEMITKLQSQLSQN